jgi:hypothetical protein
MHAQDMDSPAVKVDTWGLVPEMSAEDLDDAIERWHGMPGSQELLEFLGLSKEQYTAFVARGELPAGYRLPQASEHPTATAAEAAEPAASLDGRCSRCRSPRLTHGVCDDCDRAVDHLHGGR